MNVCTSILGAKSSMVGQDTDHHPDPRVFASGFPALAADVTTKEPEEIGIMPVM